MLPPVHSSQGVRGPTRTEVHSDVTALQVVTLALCLLTSSQGLLIALSKRSGHFNYSVTSANLMV